MKLHPLVLAFALSPLSLAAFPAAAVDLVHHGAMQMPANRIVGLWHAVGAVGPCGGTPSGGIQANVVFNAGGTLSETNTMPLAGIPNLHGISGLHTRGPGFGTWSYNPTTNTYTIDFRFFWFVNGYYHGYQSIHREGVTLSADGLELSGDIRAARYLANGTKYMEFCGSEVSERL